MVRGCSGREWRESEELNIGSRRDTLCSQMTNFFNQNHFVARWPQIILNSKNLRENHNNSMAHKISGFKEQNISKGTGRLGNKSWDHPNNTIIQISENTEENPGDLSRHAVTQTPVRNYLLTLVWKTLKWVRL